jgi:hypothetical protein
MKMKIRKRIKSKIKSKSRIPFGASPTAIRGLTAVESQS